MTADEGPEDSYITRMDAIDSEMRQVREQAEDFCDGEQYFLRTSFRRICECWRHDPEMTDSLNEYEECARKAIADTQYDADERCAKLSRTKRKLQEDHEDRLREKRRRQEHATETIGAR
jgi:hypothetical protein